MTTFEQPLLVKPKRQSDALSSLLTRAYVLNWEAVAYIVIFTLAIFTRFYDLGSRVMSHDESLHTRYSYNLYAEGNFQHTPLMHGPILFHAVAFFYSLFGDNDFTARIYPALMGVFMVVGFPLMFRRWLGKTGALLMAVMVLISPLLMYYNRYIREDTPSIFYTTLMVYFALMYIDGPLNLRRKGYWLYGFSAAMLGSLGSKESAFIYILIFTLFFALYFGVRLIQHLFKLPGKTIFYFVTISVLVGAVFSLIMYVVLSIQPLPAAVAAGAGSAEMNTLILWTLQVIVFITAILVVTGLWAFRNSKTGIRIIDILLIVLMVVGVCAVLIYAEERSHIPERAESEPTSPVIPGDEAAAVSAGINMMPIVVAWVIAGIAIALIIASWMAGWWRTLHRFPELDVLIVMGTLILPWGSPLFIWLTGASPVDYSPEGIQRALLALIPMAAISITLGLVWNWKRWLICATVFHLLFVFFFTTMFTNMLGLATGMIGSLGYWLEQQGVRRGGQPQYYYLLLIMPFYEFLPLIGGFLAMCSGLTLFWRYRKERLEEGLEKRKPQTLAPSAEATSNSESYDFAFSDAPPTTGETVYSDETPSLGEILREPSEEYPVTEATPFQRQEHPERLKHVPFLMLASWWTLFNMIGYTLAGEKMPWLGTHLTFPLIMIAAWYFGNVFDSVNWQKFRERGWLYLLLLPVLFVALFQVISPFLIGQSPFAGLEQPQLARTGQWLAVVAISGLVLLVIFWLVEKTGWRHLKEMIGVTLFIGLSVLTFRSAWMAAFINYDMATEFLVYAHGAPAIKTVLNELEDLSLRTTDGMDLRFGYDNESSWPYSWYFRDFQNAVFFGSSPTVQNLDDTVAVVAGDANRSLVEPILEDRYYRFDHIRLWWPMQDYFGLTPQRVANVFDFSPQNTQAAQLRQGLFDIWWSRDYTVYGQAVGKNFDVTQWPVSDSMSFYVRKDIASQIWSLGTGNGTVGNPLDVVEINQCTANWQLRAADVVIGEQGVERGQLTRPLDVAVGENGRVYVAEENNNRVSVFEADGTFVGLMGQGEDNSLPLFNRPNGMAVGPDGNIYVADTWNYQIKVFSPDGDLLNSWGQPGEFGADAPEEPVDGFWGPRDVAVDNNGNVYVADTGNKRIRVYDSQGTHLRDIGSAGSQPGQLDEPVGLALHPDGRLFIADTWNRRISVFALDGTFMTSYPVRGWYDELGNRPYLAVDSERNLLYVTDPDAGRVLVYDTDGNCLGSFGQPSREGFDATQFRTVGGLGLDANGNTYIADAGSGRILRFPPFQRIVDALPAEGQESSGEQISGEQQLQEESQEIEITAEATLEILETEQVTEDQEAAG
jgi:DNA-binding beta-propeller fold protein YncE